jgi:hypothetical protein
MAIRLVVSLIPTDTRAATISHDLWISGLSLAIFSFLYVLWRENKYVSHMYVKRDALEAGKITPGSLTLEEYHFIYSHWPDLFKS